MSKKTKALVSSFVAIAMSASLAIGGTYALFTSEDKVNVAVTSGKVAVTASVSDFAYSTLTQDWTAATQNGEVYETTFDGIGGSATLNGKKITLDKIVPGDAVKFNVNITNESTVDVKYRVVIANDTAKETGLFTGLNVEIDGSKFAGENVGAWTELAPTDGIVETVGVMIELPEDATNTYQGKSCEINVIVEAVQGNGEIADKWDGTVDTSWYNASASTFNLSTAEELAGLSTLSAKGTTFANKTVVLESSVDFEGEKWTPIKQFSGTFDGGDHTVSNFTLDGSAGRAGFIQNLGQYPATVKNLTLSDVNGVASSNQYFGILAASGHTSILENVHVVDCKVETTTKEAWVGGIYGYFNWTSASNCTVENLEIDATGGARFIGGFSGNMDQDLSINNCDVIDLKITLDATNGACQVGGFTGQTQTGHRQPTFTNCDVIGLDMVVSGEVQAGGFVGDAGAHTIANNCTVEGKIDASGVTDNRSFIGGFLSDSGWNNNESNKGGHKLTNCKADVDIITGGSTAGGFIGSTTAYHPNDDSNRNMPITFTNCSASGTVTVVSGATATIGGFAGEAERGTFKNCTTTSNTFIGKVWDGYTLSDDGNGTLTVSK